jgi:hypothetical protein
VKEQLAAALKANGIKCRIRDLGLKYRIVLTEGTRKQVGATVENVCNDLGYTFASGRPLEWSCWNGPHELCVYKPGSVRIVGR